MRAFPAFRRGIARLLATAAVLPPLAACAQTPPVNAGPYVPTPTIIVTELLRFGEIKPTDFLLDLGSGDGRIPITAAKDYGASGMGIDIDDKLVALANENAAKAGVAERVKFVKGDLFQMDLSQATVITTYLLPNTVTRLVPKMLAEMKPGSRVISHDYPLSPWQQDRHFQFDVPEKERISGTTRTVLYHYTVPARVNGAWELKLPQNVSRQPVRVTFRQDIARTQGSATVAGRSVDLDDVRVQGTKVSFGLPVGARMVRLEGVAEDAAIRGRLDGAAWEAVRAATR